MNVPTARFRVLLATLALVLVAAGGSPAAAQATAPSLPWVTVSPLAGTPDATPATQISFLGAPAADISQIVVRGSQSGIHAGRLEPYATGTGASYLPDRPFTVGEQVTVSAVETINGVHRAIGTSFTIGRLYALPAASGPTGATGATGAMGATGAAGASPMAGVSGTASDGVETFASLPGRAPAGGDGDDAGERSGARRRLPDAGGRAVAGRRDDRQPDRPAGLVRPCGPGQPGDGPARSAVPRARRC